MRLNEAATPAWMARALLIGVAALVVLWLVGQVLGAIFAPLRLIGQSVSCQTNVFKMTRAFRLYEDDYDDRIPPAANWMDRTFFYINTEGYLHCPTVGAPGVKLYGYAMNSKVSGKDRAEIDRPDEVEIIYDSVKLGRSASDPVSSLPIPGRHRTRPRKGAPMKPGNLIGYVGGSASVRLDKSRSPLNN
jgi:hypothetical protein